MTVSRVTAILLMLCLLAPTVHACELGEVSSWLPSRLLDLVETLCDSLARDKPTNTSQNIGPHMIPTG